MSRPMAGWSIRRPRSAGSRTEPACPTCSTPASRSGRCRSTSARSAATCSRRPGASSCAGRAAPASSTSAATLLERLEPPMIDHFAAPWVAPDRYRLRDDARRFETWESNYAGTARPAASRSTTRWARPGRDRGALPGMLADRLRDGLGQPSRGARCTISGRDPAPSSASRSTGCEADVVAGALRRRRHQRQHVATRPAPCWMRRARACRRSCAPRRTTTTARRDRAVARSCSGTVAPRPGSRRRPPPHERRELRLVEACPRSAARCTDRPRTAGRCGSPRPRCPASGRRPGTPASARPSTILRLIAQSWTRPVPPSSRTGASGLPLSSRRASTWVASGQRLVDRALAGDVDHLDDACSAGSSRRSSA